MAFVIALLALPVMAIVLALAARMEHLIDGEHLPRTTPPRHPGHPAL